MNDYVLTLYDLIKAGILCFTLIVIIETWIILVIKNELKALKVEGYIALRKHEKELYTKREIVRMNNRHNFWMAFIGSNKTKGETKQANRYNEFDDPTYKGLHRNYMKGGGKKTYNEFVMYLNRIDFVEVERLDDVLKDQSTIYFTMNSEDHKNKGESK